MLRVVFLAFQSKATGYFAARAVLLDNIQFVSISFGQFGLSFRERYDPVPPCFSVRLRHLFGQGEDSFQY